MALTGQQIDALLQPLDPRRVKQHRGNSHLEAWDDKRHLIRVFGFGGFDVEQVELTCICERSVWGEDEKRPFDGRHLVAYRARIRLVIKDPDGNEVCHLDGAAVGDAVNQPVLGDAHDLAMKAANSQALKIACTFLGDRFGLSLYNDGSTNAVVGRTLGNVTSTEHEADDEVRGGELEAPADEPAPSLPLVSNDGNELAERAKAMAERTKAPKGGADRAAGVE